MEILDDQDDIKNYEPRLNQEWVQVLINLRMKYSKQFTRKRNSAAEAWKNILREMTELGAPAYVTLDKIKKKWMNLIARYKHLKFSTNQETITWPYFEQIDRAYSRNPSIVELRKCTSTKQDSFSDESFVSDYAEYMMKKQKFTSILIQLRYAYRHLFTGKKYAAQKGWMVIQNLLPNGQNYTIEQISKCWQNLIQRYKILNENEKDHTKISWVHFPNMHDIMTKRDDVVVPTTTTTTTTDLEIVSSTDEPPIKAEAQSPVQTIENEADEATDTKPNITSARKRKAATTLNDLLGYMVQRDLRRDQQHRELVEALNRLAMKAERK